MKDKARYQNHPLWDNVKGILASEDLGNLPSGTRGYLLHLLHDLDKRRESTNPFYVQERSLDDLNNRLSNVASWIPNPNNASTIDQYVDACFATLSSEWPANNGRKVADISKSTYDDFIDEATSKIASAREAADKVEELSRQFQEKKDEYEAGLVELKSSYVETIDESKTQLEKRRDELGDEFESEVKERADKARSSLAAVEDKYKQSLDKTKADVEQILHEVENTANSISGKAMTTDYAKYAKDKERAVWVYDISAILFAVIGIGLVAFALTGLHADETSASVFKLAVSVASFTVSGFLFKRGTYNQREAKAARRTELTLREYRPFIANLSEEDKRDITYKIADRIFIKGEIGDKEEKTISNALFDRGLSEKQLASFTALVKALSKDSSN